MVDPKELLHQLQQECNKEWNWRGGDILSSARAYLNDPQKFAYWKSNDPEWWWDGAVHTWYMDQDWEDCECGKCIEKEKEICRFFNIPYGKIEVRLWP